MKWLITGKNGQLATSLIQELNKRGINNSAFTHNEMDIINFDSVLKIVEEEKPEVILNTAAWTNVDEAESASEKLLSVNSLGAENMARAAKRVDARFIQISTDYVFSGPREIPWNTSSETCPNNKYGASKAEGEKRVIETYDSGAYVLRTAWLYSPYRNNFVKKMIHLALFGDGKVKVVNDQIGQPTSAQDLSKFMIEIIESRIPSGIYHGTNSGQTTWFDFAKLIFQLLKKDSARVVAMNSSELNLIAQRPQYSVLDNSSVAAYGLKPMKAWNDAITEQILDIEEQVKREFLTK